MSSIKAGEDTLSRTPTETGDATSCLIALAKQGDATAKERLFEEFRPFLTREAQNTIGPELRRRCDPGDIVQEAYLAATRGFDSFKGTSGPEFSAWITQILRRESLSTLRYHSAGVRDLRRERDPKPTSDSMIISWFQPLATDMSPSQHFIRGERAIKLLKAMGELPPEQRLAIRLRFLEGEALATVAERMGCGPDAVVGLIRRGLVALRRQIGSQ